MKIILFCESQIVKLNGNYYAKDSWIKFPLFFSKYCDLFSIVCTTIDNQKWNKDDYSIINIESSKIIFLSNYNSFKGYYKNYILEHKKWKSIINEQIDLHDIIWIRTPSPLLNIIFKAKNISSKIVVSFLAGDFYKQSDILMKSKGIMYLLYKWYIGNYIEKEKSFYRSHADLLYYYSNELLDRFQEINCKKKPFRTPIISNNDIYLRDDTCKKSKIKILRVCWLLPSKGLEYLIDAIKMLKDNNYNIELNIIGGERHLGYQDVLVKYINDKDLTEEINLLGWMKNSDITEFFISHDIQVISSLSEGTPRVILEGLSKSIPLVTTNVGGINTMLKNNQDCIIVEPKNSEELKKGIELIIQDKELRKNLIKNGIKNSMQWTIENKSVDLLEDMKTLLLK